MALTSAILETSSAGLTCALRDEVSSSLISPYFQKLGDLTSLFLFLSSYIGSSEVDGFISNISLGSSYGWYFRVDQFELIFLCLLMLQIFMLRYIEILPINMNNLFLGDPSGRRKRSTNLHKICQRDEFAESMFALLRKLDDGECFPFALCELGKIRQNTKTVSPSDFQLPLETDALIQGLNLTGEFRMKSANSKCERSSGLKTFEDAVLLGISETFANGTACENRYSACPLTSEDVIHHIKVLAEAEIIQ